MLTRKSYNSSKTCKVSKNSGADAVKFQIYFADDFISKNHSRFDHLKNNLFQKLGERNN